MTTRRPLTPLEITMLLHIYAIAEPIPDVIFPAQKETLRTFERDGLIVVNVESNSGYSVTARGKKLVHMLCNTPYPQPANPQWVDPRTGE